MNEKTESDRMLNEGIVVELKKLGKVTVKELSLEAILKLGSDLALLIQEVKVDKKEGLKFLVNLLRRPDTFQAVCNVAASSTGRASEEFKDMGSLDWLKWMTAFKEVIHWEELSELFIQVFPMELMRNAIKSQPKP